MSSVDLKVVLLGHTNVGKTSIFNRYVYDDFGKTSMTIGAYFSMKQCRVNNRSYNLAIWDTAGEEKFESLTNFYCRQAKGALVCYDITNYSTFEKLQRWIDKIGMEAEEGCAIIIVGNKCDVVEEDPSKRAVPLAEAKRFGKQVGAPVIEASAATGKNVELIFEQVVTVCLERNLHGSNSNGSSVKLSKDKKDTKCCS